MKTTTDRENLHLHLFDALDSLNHSQKQKALLGKAIHDLRNLATPIMMIADFLGMDESPVPRDSLKNDLLETLTYLNTVLDDLDECRASRTTEPTSARNRLRDVLATVHTIGLPVDIEPVEETSASSPMTTIAVHGFIQLIMCVVGAHPEGGSSESQWSVAYQEEDVTWALVFTHPKMVWPENFIKKLSGFRLTWEDSFQPNWVLLQSIVRQYRGTIDVRSVNEGLTMNIGFSNLE